MTTDLKTHAELLRKLHHGDQMLVLPNVWDAASATIAKDQKNPRMCFPPLTPKGRF